MSKYLAVIPARKGSKGLPNKNIYPLLGTPLVLWTIKAALNSRLCDVVVTTDDERVKELAKNYPIKIVDRPDFLCGDDVPLAPVIAHAYRNQVDQYNAIITLQPSSPFRSDLDIINSVARFEMSKADSLLSVTEELKSVWEKKPSGEVFPLKERHLNRQQEQPIYVANGAIFITKPEILLNQNNRLGGKIEIYPMSVESSIDIHTMKDIEYAEWIYNREIKQC